MQFDRRDNRDGVYKLLIGRVVAWPIASVSTVASFEAICSSYR